MMSDEQKRWQPRIGRRGSPTHDPTSGVDASEQRLHEGIKAIADREVAERLHRSAPKTRSGPR